MNGPPPPLLDDFGRMHNYLRISACLSSPHEFQAGFLTNIGLTERCNLRCCVVAFVIIIATT